MNKLLLLIAFITINANAGLDEKIAASFAAKYEVCALKLKNVSGYKFKAIALKAEADEIHRKKLGGGGYLHALEKEKKKAWSLSPHKCRKIANDLKNR